MQRSVTIMKLLVGVGVIGLFGGCAATVPRTTKTAEFEKGLKYSEWLYSQPIDILKNEPFSLPMPERHPVAQPTQKPVSRPAVHDTTLQPFAVQLASFRIEANARRFFTEVKRTHPGWKFQLRRSQGLWRVVVGFYGTHDDARAVRDILRQQGFPDAWIVHFQ